MISSITLMSQNRSLLNSNPLRNGLISVNIFSYVMYANLHISTFCLKFLVSEYDFSIRPAHDIVPRTIGFKVTLSTTVPVTTKMTDPILHASSIF